MFPSLESECRLYDRLTNRMWLKGHCQLPESSLNRLAIPVSCLWEIVLTTSHHTVRKPKQSTESPDRKELKFLINGPI